MSEALEDGEIPDENEPSPEPPIVERINDETLIDKIIQQESSTSTGDNSKDRRRYSHQNDRRAYRSTKTSWHTNGGGRQIRPPPAESTIFGMQPPPAADIARLQTFITNTSSYEPHYSQPPLHYFPPPPPPLMSINYSQPPPSIPHALSAPPPPPHQAFQPISPTPIAVFRGGNYDDVSMDVDRTISPDEPQEVNFAIPPIQIPLEAVVPEVSKSNEDEAALRAFLLSQLNQNKKRALAKAKKSAEKDGEESSPKKSKKSSRSRKNSKTTVSDSVIDMFEDHVPVQSAPPPPRIEVKIASKSVNSILEETLEDEDLRELTSTSVSSDLQSREKKRRDLEEKMKLANQKFASEKKRVLEASEMNKKAIDMANEAAELMKKAEELTKAANELRIKSREESTKGRETLKKLIGEKQQIQNDIDMMSIDDLEIIDDSLFPEFIVTAVKLEPKKSEEEIPAEAKPTPKFIPLDPATPATPEAPPPPAEKLASNEANEVEMETENQKNEESDISSDSRERGDQSADGNENENEIVAVEEEEEVEGEDEYEEVEEEQIAEPVPPPTTQSAVEVVTVGVKKETSVTSCAAIAKLKDPSESNLNAEQLLREKLLNKFARSGASPDIVQTLVKPPQAPPPPPEKQAPPPPPEKQAPPPLAPPAPSTSSSILDPAKKCREVLMKMCKFELNGKCERPRECHFTHLHDITDRKKQCQLLEGLFREVFHYKEADIEPAVQQTMHFLPQFEDQFEKMMDQFFSVVIEKTPDYKNRLFTFFNPFLSSAMNRH